MIMNDIRAIDIRLLGKKRTGDEAVFFGLTKELLKLDREHQYFLLTDERDPQKIAILQGRLECVGQANVRFIPLAGKNRFVWNLFTLPWFLFTNRVDVYHTQYILPLFVPKRTKVVNHIHDVSFKALPHLIGWKDRLFLSLLIPRSLRRADRIITPTRFTKDEVVRYFHVPEEKIIVINNALSEDFLVSEAYDIPALRAKYQLPEKYIIYVGTLQPRKNIPFFIRSFAEMRSRLPGIKLVLVGNRQAHHFDHDINEAIEELDLESHVIFPGYIEQRDLPGVIRGASVFAFPSLYEGFGIPLLEAMSQGVPVAASDIPCLHEVSGQAARYFSPTSVASCTETLYTLLTDSEQRDSGISKGKAQLSLFSWKNSASSLVQVYETVK